MAVLIETKVIDTQIRFEDIDNGYMDFVEKFKPKKTTDDCYTPEAVYDVVAQYVTDRYGIRREDMVRPFWPGGDYKRYPYPVGGWWSIIRRSASSARS